MLRKHDINLHFCKKARIVEFKSPPESSRNELDSKWINNFDFYDSMIKANDLIKFQSKDNVEMMCEDFMIDELSQIPRDGIEWSKIIAFESPLKINERRTMETKERKTISLKLFDSST